MNTVISISFNRGEQTEEEKQQIRDYIEGLGWTHSSVGRLSNEKNPMEGNISSYTFYWNKPSEPIFPENVEYEISTQPK